MASLPYQDLRIVSFRGLQGVELSDCGAVNLLVGENNCGKTSVLEALLLLSHPTDVQQWEAAVALRGEWPFADMRFRGGRLERLYALSWLFPHQDGQRLPIQIEAAGKRPLLALNARAEAITGEPPERPSVSENEVIEAPIRNTDRALKGSLEGSEQRHARGMVVELSLHWSTEQGQQVAGSGGAFRMVLWERGVSLQPRRAPQNPAASVAFATPSDGYLAARFSRLVRANQKDRALELVRRLDPDVLDLVMVSPEDLDSDNPAFPRRGWEATLHVRHARAGLLPVQAMGDGTRRAIHLAALLTEVGQDGVLLIDEIEVGMHTSVLRHVFGWLCAACRATGVQLFATTHSLEAVDAILATVPTEDLVLYRLKGGRARRYSGELLRTARVELGHEVR